MLRYVVAASEHGTFFAAAIHCAVSPVAVSKGIAAIEKKLGARLFHRSGNQGVRLTAEGRDLMPYIERALAAWEPLERRVAM